MSGETEANTSGWTVDTLSAHLTALMATAEEVSVLQGKLDAVADLMEAKFVTFRVLVESQAEKVALALDASQKAIDKADDATGKAIGKAEMANNKGFQDSKDAVAKLAEQQLAYITRIEAMAAIERNTERINDLAARLDRAERG